MKFHLESCFQSNHYRQILIKFCLDRREERYGFRVLHHSKELYLKKKRKQKGKEQAQHASVKLSHRMEMIFSVPNRDACVPHSDPLLYRYGSTSVTDLTGLQEDAALHDVFQIWTMQTPGIK